MIWGGKPTIFGNTQVESRNDFWTSVDQCFRQGPGPRVLTRSWWMASGRNGRNFGWFWCWENEREGMKRWTCKYISTNNMHITHTCQCICISIYIYIERERERDRYSTYNLLVPPTNWKSSLSRFSLCFIVRGGNFDPWIHPKKCAAEEQLRSFRVLRQAVPFADLAQTQLQVWESKRPRLPQFQIKDTKIGLIEGSLTTIKSLN